MTENKDLEKVLQRMNERFDSLQYDMGRVKQQQEDLSLRLDGMEAISRSGLPAPLSHTGGGYSMIEPESRWRKERPFRR